MSAIDALLLKGLDKINDWEPGRLLYELERYNGFGYRAQGIPSPYVWAGSNQSDERGKYVADHVFSQTAVEKQLGCAVLVAGLIKLDPSLDPVVQAIPVPQPNPTITPTAAAAGAVVAGTVIAAAKTPPSFWQQIHDHLHSFLPFLF